jgi:dTDP-4-dehydrorhamnose 3,5-epimerase
VKLEVEETAIRDVRVVLPGAFVDERGFFMEVYRRDLFEQVGLPTDFVQLNHSRSARNVLRGLHFQWGPPPMGKLMRVTVGSAFLVAVDIRQGSPTLGAWVGVDVSAENRRQVWAPAGFARGFAVTADDAEIEYLCTGTYNAGGEAGIRWDDPAIGIEWPISAPILSAKDQAAQTLAEWLQRPEAANFRAD